MGTLLGPALEAATLDRRDWTMVKAVTKKRLLKYVLCTWHYNLKGRWWMPVQTSMPHGKGLW